MERLWKKTQLRGQTGKGRGSGKKNASSGVFFFFFFFFLRVLSRAARLMLATGWRMECGVQAQEI